MKVLDKLKEPYQNLQYFKDWLEGREESEIVLISVENLNWLANTIESLKEENKVRTKEIIELKTNKG